MFQGFNKDTITYYETIRRDNSRIAHKENETLYLEGVKYPLEEMYYELYNYFNRLDNCLLSNKRRCISSAYNDARFSKENPIKEYFYLRFKLEKADNKNVLGFFLDAALDGYRYGLNIYHMDAKGMERIRDVILDNKHYATETIQKFNTCGLLELQGERFKKDNYPKESAVLREWLERKRISLYHEENINSSFFNREIIDQMFSAFDSVKDIYFMLKEAL